MSNNLSKFIAASAMAGLVAMAAGPALAQDMEQLAEAARQEGQLVFYSSVPDSRNQAWVEAFQAEYPEIEVSWIRLVSSSLFARYVGEAESGAHNVDLLMSGSAGLYLERPELFEDISGYPGISGLKIKPQNNNYAILYITPHLVTYNTNLVSEADLEAHLATWEGIADPFWDGRVAITDPQATPNNMSFFKLMQETYGEEVLRGLAANAPGIFDSGTPASQQVAAGAYSIAFPTSDTQSASIRESGAPVATYVPDGPAHGLESSIAIPKQAPHPNAAKLFLAWVMSPTGGQKIVCETGSVPQVDGVEGDCLEASDQHHGAEELISEEVSQSILSNLGL